MNENSNVVRLRHLDEIDDPLTNILRSGARQLLVQAIELETEVFPAEMKDLRLADGRDRVVRHGPGPERTIQRGIGAVEGARVKIRDRGAAGDGERIRFTSAILANEEPGCASAGALSARHLDRGLPGDLGGAVGQGRAEPVAGGDFPADGGVAGEYGHWQKRDLSARRYLYVWADGVFLQARMES
jgi:putative transposase